MGALLPATAMAALGLQSRVKCPLISSWENKSTAKLRSSDPSLDPVPRPGEEVGRDYPNIKQDPSPSNSHSCGWETCMTG